MSERLVGMHEALKEGYEKGVKDTRIEIMADLKELLKELIKKIEEL